MNVPPDAPVLRYIGKEEECETEARWLPPLSDFKWALRMAGEELNVEVNVEDCPHGLPGEVGARLEYIADVEGAYLGKQIGGRARDVEGVAKWLLLRRKGGCLDV